MHAPTNIDCSTPRPYAPGRKAPHRRCSVRAQGGRWCPSPNVSRAKSCPLLPSPASSLCVHSTPGCLRLACSPLASLTPRACTYARTTAPCVRCCCCGGCAAPASSVVQRSSSSSAAPRHAIMRGVCGAPPRSLCVQVHRTNEWRIGVRRVEQVRGGEHAPHGTRVAQISVALRRRTTPEESLARFEEIHFFKNNRPSSHRLRSTSHPMGVNRTVLRGETVEWSGRERNNRRVETGQTHLSRLVQPHRHEINTTAPARSVDVTRTLRVLSARAEGSRSRAAPCVKVG
jgi:hypothetical protein